MISEEPLSRMREPLPVQKYPVECITPENRTAFCYRSQELLRLVHNEVGRWHREGLTSTEYSKLPQFIKDEFDYKGRIEKEEFEMFRSEIFDPLNDMISGEILKNREIFKNSNEWDVDLDNLKEI